MEKVLASLKLLEALLNFKSQDDAVDYQVWRAVRAELDKAKLTFLDVHNAQVFINDHVEQLEQDERLYGLVSRSRSIWFEYTNALMDWICENHGKEALLEAAKEPEDFEEDWEWDLEKIVEDTYVDS